MSILAKVFLIQLTSHGASLLIVIFVNVRLRNSKFNNCYLYASHFTRAEFLSDKEISFIKSNLTAVVFDRRANIDREF